MKVSIRPFKSDDLTKLVAYANNPKIAANLTDAFPHPYTKEAGEKFIERVSNHEPNQVFVIECDGAFCGAIGIHPQDDIMRKNAELGYWIAEEFWGKGITSKAVDQIIPYAFENFDITRLFARPYGPNKASQKVLEKCGFELEARLSKTIFKNGQFLNELIYAIRK